jgi:hypothetical protein
MKICKNATIKQLFIQLLGAKHILAFLLVTDLGSLDNLLLSKFFNLSNNSMSFNQLLN